MDTTKKITVQTLVSSPISKVWEYWNQPEHVTKWYQASDDWHAPHAENDLREGGKFSTTMAARDGSMSFDFEGVYDRVEENRVIDYTIADGRKVWIAFDDMGNSTKITQTFEMENEHPEEMQRGGWQAILDNFKNFAENH
ncbi:MAG TPA: SRPBCC family protein [Flavobacterium sp.]|jgi:uncharacterized protein YndB with AHSA1/START domain